MKHQANTALRSSRDDHMRVWTKIAAKIVAMLTAVYEGNPMPQVGIPDF
jgi:hypothetical protein